MREPTAAELSRIAVVQEEFRAYWKAANQPSYKFEGAREDVQALDYLDYELGYPKSEYQGAAFIWGEVLRRHYPLLQWRIGDEGEWFLVADDFPSYSIWPYARIVETQNSSIPQFGKYQILTEKTVVDFLLFSDLDDDAQGRLKSLIDWDYYGDFMLPLKHLVSKLSAAQ
ncbi:MAG: hypothetical protein IAG10_29960 [Planctomycetaceae bacterium]|nr:hypothetical protein [Planctomycetaceae bacterium]